MGSSTAYWLSKYQDVALIEQYDLLHSQGSSHGQSRVIRRTYQEEHFASMMREAYSLWHAIEEETGAQLYIPVGGVDFGKEGNSDLKRTSRICDSLDMDHEILDARQLRDKFPAYNISDEYYGIYQQETGILNASKTLDILQQQTAKQGGQILANTPVREIYPRDEIITVETKNGSFRAQNLVITAGTWVNNLLDKFDLRVRMEVWKLTFAYWKITRPELFRSGKFPVFIHWGENADYGFPIHERPGYVKIAPHINPLIPKTVEKDGHNPVNEELLDYIASFIQETFDGIDTTPTYPETCLYTMTPDENFILDYIPGHDNIIVAGGFSGHGFKFTPLIGQIIQQLMMDQDVAQDLTHFAIENFLVEPGV